MLDIGKDSQLVYCHQLEGLAKAACLKNSVPEKPGAAQLQVTPMLRVLFSIFLVLSVSSPGQVWARDFTVYEERVLAIYIAYYGRPADSGGLAYWSSRLRAEGGQIDSIIDAFGESREYRERFGNLTATQLVTNLYGQLFGREPDKGGLNFYVGKLQSREWSLPKIAVVILDGIRGDDVAIIDNRIEFSKQYVSLSESGALDAVEPEGLAELMDAVGSSQDSVAVAVRDLERHYGTAVSPEDIVLRVFLPGDIVEYAGTISWDGFFGIESYDITVRHEFFESGYSHQDKNVMARRDTVTYLVDGDSFSSTFHFWQESNGAWFNLVDSDGDFYFDTGEGSLGLQVIPAPLVPFSNIIRQFQFVDGPDAAIAITMGTASTLVSDREIVATPLGNLTAIRVFTEDRYEFLRSFGNRRRGDTDVNQETVWISPTHGVVRVEGDERSYTPLGSLDDNLMFQLVIVWKNY